jgi:protoporphyrinogen oxidase
VESGRRPPVAVIGGGLTGLVAADRLLAAGVPVTVFEKYPEAGGLVGTFEAGGERLECFYHHLFTSDADFIALAGELGLGADLEWLSPEMGFFVGGRLYRFGTPGSLLAFAPLGLAGRLQFVLSTLKLRGITDWTALEGETAAGWFRAHGYGRAFDVVWAPLLSQKYGRRAEEVSLVWLWGKIALRSRSRNRSGLGESLGYLRGSFGRVVDALVARLRERGGEFVPARPVRIVRKAGEAFAVETSSGSRNFPRVLSTVAIPELLRLAPDLPGEIRALWSGISYGHALCPVLELDRPLSRFYWTNVGESDMPFGGVIEHTNYIPKERYGGRHVVYLSDYVLPDDPKWRMRDEELWALYTPGLERFSPEFRKAAILSKRIFRAEYAQPIVTPHYSRVLPAIRTPLPGLYSAAMAQIYPEDRGQNYAVRMGRTAAETILADLA